MTRSAADDIRMVQCWGYTHSEALEMVTRRAVYEARRIADEAGRYPNRAVLERHLAYLDELRSICLATSANSNDRRREKRGLGSSAASAAAASAALSITQRTPAIRR
jgi:homoserine kinase